MAISRQALDQVRHILRDLDQRIDDARRERTTDAPEHDEAHSAAGRPAGETAPEEEHRDPQRPAHPGRARPKRPSV